MLAPLALDLVSADAARPRLAGSGRAYFHDECTEVSAPEPNDRPGSLASRSFFGSPALWRAANVAGFVAIAVWALWWGDAIYRLYLYGDKYTQIRLPMFGADFWSQSDYAARLFARGVDPYASRGHLFHYPPIVIRLFLWTPHFSIETALRMWVVFLIFLIIVAALAAAKVRERLAVGPLPASLAIALVLFSSPVIFQLERANFDLITLAAILIALPLFRRGTNTAEFLAGCVLAIGPWVKIYPGLMGLGLLALRRWRAAAGFIVAGALIGLAAPAETVRSFDVLALAMKRVKFMSYIDQYYTWSHSISVGYLKLAQAASGTPFGKVLLAIPIDVIGGGLVLGGASWVSYRIYRLRGCDALLYPLLLWLNALGSCVGVIANDYSLTFLPLAAIAVHSFKDPWFVKISMLLLAIWWQPLDPHILGLPFLIIKLLGIASVGVSLVRRARELASETSALPSARQPALSESALQGA